MNTANLAVMGPTEALPAQSETAALVAMIDRLARDPSVDLARVERLMEMRRDVRREEAEEAANIAMSEVQARMMRVAADAQNSSTRSKYATYAALDRALRPLYVAAGFGLSYGEEDSPKPDHVRVVCYLSRGVFVRKYHVDMPADGKGAKGNDVMTKTHATGSAFTYGQRYLLKLIFNVAIGNDPDDDDGNAAGGYGRNNLITASPNITSGVPTFPGDRITSNQLAELLKLSAEVMVDVTTICEAYHISSLAELTPSQFQKVKARLKTKKAPPPSDKVPQ